MIKSGLNNAHVKSGVVNMSTPLSAAWFTNYASQASELTISCDFPFSVSEGTVSPQTHI